MSIETRVRIGGSWVLATALLDSGAEVNMIHPRMLTAMEMNRLESHTQVSALFDATATPLGSCDLYTQVVDVYAVTETVRSRYVVADIAELDMILGYPWLEATDPIISWKRRTLVFPYDPEKIKMCSGKKEIRRAAKESAYVMMVLAHPVVGDHEDAGTTPRPVPLEYQSFVHLFSNEEASKLPPYNGHAHAIELEGGVVPPAGHIYPLAEPELEVLRIYIEEALASGRISWSRSPAGAPVLFVPKKGGQLRLCVDYRALNKVTKKNRAPLPLISEILDRLGKARVYTKLDLKEAYHRLRIREGDEWKTAFRCRYGHFEYNVMPFGLVNAPATFQTFINDVLGDLVDTTCIAYLDDILIYSEKEADHTQHVRRVLERLQQHNLFLNLEKCEFHVQRVAFLGFIVDAAGLHMEPSRIQAIQQWPVPTSIKDIQVFLGFTRFYQRFIKGYSKVVAPLTDLLKGTEANQKNGTSAVLVQLDTRALEAFAKLRLLFTRAPLLQHYDPSLPTRVESDASAFAIGAILSQLKGGRWHPVAFFSRKLKGAELRYDTPDAELMAIVGAFRVWRSYLAYVQEPVQVMTDHLNHRYLATKAKLSARQARWMEELAVFDFVIEYREGKKNPADGLSRRPDLRDSGEVEEARRAPLASFLERFERRDLQGVDNEAHGVSGQRGDVAGRSAVAPWREPSVAIVRTLFRNLRLAETVSLAQVSGDLVASENVAGMATHRREAAGEPQRVTGDSPTEKRGDPPRESLWHRRPGPILRVGWRSQRLRGGDAAPTAEGTVREPASSSLPNLIGVSPSGDGLPDLAGVSLESDGARTATPRLLPPLAEAIHGAQRRDVFVTEEQWKQWRGRSGTAGSTWTQSESDSLLRFKGCVYVPPEPGLRGEVLKLFHDSATAGHQGVTKTLKRISRMFFWQSLRKDVRRYVSTCTICQRTKARHHLPYGELAALPVPTTPWKEISMDFIVKLPVSKSHIGKACDSILVVVDRFTKYSLYIPTTERITSDGLATLLLHHVYRLFGIPDGIVSDRGSLFTSKFWASLCDQLATTRRLSTAFHPQTDGQTERVNQSVEHYLRTYCGFAQDDWASKLFLAEFVFNTSWHSAIRESPAKALFGFDPRGPNDIPLARTNRHVPLADERARELRHSREVIAKVLRHAQTQYEKWYNKGRKRMLFNKGDWVLLSTRHLNTRRPCRKFTEKYLGPYQIEGIVGDRGMAYKLRLPASARVHPTFPISSLEPWRGRDGEEPASPKDDPFPANNEYEVEAILAHRKNPPHREYLIRWKGYDEAENSWEPRRNIADGPLLEDYEKSQSR